MIRLFLHAPAPAETAAAFCFGGRPVAPRHEMFEWPCCRSCTGPMTYLGRLPAEPDGQRLVLIFMCENNPGMCSDWEADAGGNRALVVMATAPLQALEPPRPDTIRTSRYGAEVVPANTSDPRTASREWVASSARSPRDFLGQSGPEPDWLQGDETPSCDCCERPMRFVVRLEQGPDSASEMNFGGGVAYVFVCAQDKPTAKFLWQCG